MDKRKDKEGKNEKYCQNCIFHWNKPSRCLKEQKRDGSGVIYVGRKYVCGEHRWAR